MGWRILLEENAIGRDVKGNMRFGKLLVKEVIAKTLVIMHVEKLYRNYYRWAS